MLTEFERQRLLVPGWAGDLSEEELAYIKSQLRESASLRRKWGFRPTAKRLAESRIRAIAKHGRVSHRKASSRFGSKSEQLPAGNNLSGNSNLGESKP